MPTIINPYKSGSTMGEDLFGLGGLADAFFGPKASQSALLREKFKEAERQNLNLPLYADAMAAGGDPGNIARLGILSGQTGADVGNYGRYVTVNKNPNALESGPVTASILGAGGAYSSTPAGTMAHIAQQQATDLEKTNRLIAADELKNQRELIQVHAPATPENPTGYATITRAQFLANPGKFVQVAPSDINKSAVATSLLPTATPEQRRTYTGMEPGKDKGNIYYVTDPLGNIVDQGVTEDNGRTDITGKPVVVPAGHKLGISSPLNPTAISGLGTPGAAVKDIRESRIATEAATTQIDNVRKLLAQPNADAALGIVGQGAVVLNNLRSQVDALTGTARELGYGSYADKLNAGAKDFIDKNPNLRTWAQQRGIDRGLLQSQLSSLAYVIARANNQGGGALGVRDVEDALREVGANMHDPAALSTILGNVKDRLLQRQSIVERVTSGTVPATTRSALGLPQPNAPAVPAPAVPGAARGGTTSTGVTWSVEP